MSPHEPGLAIGTVQLVTKFFDKQIELLAIPLGRQNAAAKWRVIRVNGRFIQRFPNNDITIKNERQFKKQRKS